MTELTQETFAPHVNTTFFVSHSDEETEVELIEVSDLKRTAGQERFWLLFRGPRQVFVPQGTYQFRHKAMGEFDLFIVPVREDNAGFYYEANFNRLMGAAKNR